MIHTTNRPPRRIKRVYIAGPYGSPNPHQVDRNISQAVEFGVQVAALGACPMIPHANTAHPTFSKVQHEEFWYEVTMDFMRDSDAVFLLPNWRDSGGARREHREATEMGMPVFETLAGLRRWLEGVEDA